MRTTITILLATTLFVTSRVCASDADLVAPLRVTAVAPAEAGLGDRLRVTVAGLPQALASKLDPRKLALYLDGREMKGITASPVGITASPANTRDGVLELKLERTDASRDAWAALLGSPNASRRPTPVSIGLSNQGPVPSPDGATPTFNLIVFRPMWLIATTIGLLLAIAGFWILAVRSDLIRDSVPSAPPAGARHPYSLARVQMAFWFFLVLGGLLLIFLITGDWNVLNDQALILIGIGAGTALGAAVVEANKQASADRELATLQPELAKLQAEQGELGRTVQQLSAVAAPTADEQSRLTAARVALPQKVALVAAKQAQVTAADAKQTKPTSEGFLRDLLTDVNGVSFHRFQMVVWTIVLGIFFVTNVYQNLAMPEFDKTLLALTGISAGTYLGFKIPERQT
jgi:hypothetical protein